MFSETVKFALYIKKFTYRGPAAFSIYFLASIIYPFSYSGFLLSYEIGIFGKFYLYKGTKVLNIKHFSFKMWTGWVWWLFFSTLSYCITSSVSMLLRNNAVSKKHLECIQEPSLIKNLHEDEDFMKKVSPCFILISFFFNYIPLNAQFSL